MSITIGTVTISKNIEHNSRFWFDRLNQVSHETLSGDILSYDNGPTILRGVIRVNYVTESEATSFRNWLRNSVRYRRYSFTITPESFIDLGMGEGVAVTDAYFDSTDASTDGIIEPVGRASKFNIVFPYRKRIVPTVGTADQEGVVS